MQPPYARLNLAPVKGRVLWSDHHDQGRGVQVVLRFRDHIVFLFTGSPDRVSPLSGRATRARIRPVIRDGPLEGGPSCPDVLPRFRLPAFRFSVIRFPPRNSALLTVGLPAKRPDPDGVTAFRTHESRPGWVLSVAREQRCSSRLERVPNSRPPQSQRPVPALRHNNPSCGLCITRHQREFKRTKRTQTVFTEQAAAG